LPVTQKNIMPYNIEFDISDPNARKYVLLLISEIERNRGLKSVDQVIESDVLNIAFQKVVKGAQVILSDCSNETDYVNN